jgi:hypothetical protein
MLVMNAVDLSNFLVEGAIAAIGGAAVRPSRPVAQLRPPIDARSSPSVTGSEPPRQPLDHAPDKARRLGPRLALLPRLGSLVPVFVAERAHRRGHEDIRAQERPRVPFCTPGLWSAHVAPS